MRQRTWWNNRTYNSVYKPRLSFAVRARCISLQWVKAQAPLHTSNFILHDFYFKTFRRLFRSRTKRASSASRSCILFSFERLFKFSVFFPFISRSLFATSFCSRRVKVNLRRRGAEIEIEYKHFP